MPARLALGIVLLAGCASTREERTPTHFWIEARASCDNPTAAALGLRGYTRATLYRWVFRGVGTEDDDGEEWPAENASEAFHVPPGSEASLGLSEGDRNWDLAPSRVTCSTPRLDARTFSSDVLVRLAAMGAGVPRWTLNIRTSPDRHRSLVAFLKRMGVREVTTQDRLVPIEDLRWREHEGFEARFGPHLVACESSRDAYLRFSLASSDLDAWLRLVDEVVVDWK